MLIGTQREMRLKGCQIGPLGAILIKKSHHGKKSKTERDGGKFGLG